LRDYSVQISSGSRSVVFETLADDPAFDALHFTREELDVRIQDQIETAWKRARDLCMDNPDEQVQQIVLTGNGARYPLCEKVMKDVFADGKFFRYRPQRVRLAGKDAEFAVAKGAAIAEWYQQREPTDFWAPDQQVVGLRLSEKQILPYSLYLEQRGRKQCMLKRGEKFWDQTTGAALKEIQSIPFNATEVVTIHQGLRDHQQPQETVAYCQFDLHEILKEYGASQSRADVEIEIILCVDREYTATGLIRWVVKGETKKEVRLIPNSIPPAPQEAEKEPFSGRH
jgi:molecular chaperone DnaK (HSP70)